jgi:hypothetical protein
MPRNHGSNLDPLTHTLLVAFIDWRYGIQNGKAEAASHDMTDAGDVLHAERLIDAQVQRATADRRREFRRSSEVAHQRHQAAALEREHATREVADLDGRDADLAPQEEALGERRGPGVFAYGLALSMLLIVTLPLDFGVASWLPLPSLGQWLLTVGIGVATLICAHLAAEKIEELEDSHGERERRRFRYRKDQLAIVAGVGVAVFVLIVVAIWRGQVFAAEAKATGMSIGSGVVSLALGALAALAFVSAVLVGIRFARMAPLRAVRKHRARIKAERAERQAVADRATGAQREAEVEVVYLAQQEQQAIEAIRFWGEERKARLRQRTAWVSLKERHKLASRSSLRTAIGRSRASIG